MQSVLDRVTMRTTDSGVSYTVDHSVKYIPDPAGLGRRTFEGWASFVGMDYQGEDTPPTAFMGALQRYLKKNPVLCWHHDLRKPIGRILEARIDFERGIYIVGEVFRSDSTAYAKWQNTGEFDPSQIADLRALADRVWEQMKAGIVRGLSWQGNSLKVTKFDDATGNFYKENSKIVDLLEISLTATQVQPDSQVVGLNLTAKAMDAPDCGATEGDSQMSETTISPQEGLDSLIQSLQDFEGDSLPEDFQPKLVQTLKALGLELKVDEVEEVEESEDNKVQLEGVKKALMTLTTTLEGMQDNKGKRQVAPRSAAASHEESEVAPPKPTGAKVMTIAEACAKALENVSSGNEEACDSISALDSIKLMSVVTTDRYGENGVIMQHPKVRDPANRFPNVTLSKKCYSYLSKLGQQAVQ